MRLINRKPGRLLAVALVLLPFLAVILVYSVASDIRRAENPRDKLLPAPGQIVATAHRLFTEPDRRSGRILILDDTIDSIQRLRLGVALAALIALVLGLIIGLIPLVRAGLEPFVGVLSMIPPLALLPILFITLGIGEASKVALIIIGIAPIMTRDLALRVREIPVEMIVKAQTLGASTLAIALSVVLPQILPRLFTAVRLGLGPAWLFLIAAEAVASESGLGYRIFLVRRYLAMDIILVYVAWITVLAVFIDFSLRRISAFLFSWAGEAAR
ncbi:MAG: ABC transporter permease subunit [Pseudomonadota bacterium]